MVYAIMKESGYPALVSTLTAALIAFGSFTHSSASMNLQLRDLFRQTMPTSSKLA